MRSIKAGRTLSTTDPSKGGDTIYQEIKNRLAPLMPCYDPGVQIGEVKAPYCVIHDAGTKPQERARGMLGQHIYEIVLLVPVSDQAQAQLQMLSRRVRAALSGVRGLKYTGDAAPTALESTYKGSAQSLIYRAPEVLININ